LTSTTAPFFRRQREANQPFRRDPAGLLGGLGETLFAQPIDRRLDVAASVGERGLAVHHAGAGLVAQFLDQRSADIRHRVPRFRLSRISHLGLTVLPFRIVVMLREGGASSTRQTRRNR
jgi:hypothetical protein